MPDMIHRAVNLRLEPDLIQALEAMVAIDRAKLEGLGLDGEANFSTVLRRLIRAEARRLQASGEMPTAPASPATPPAPSKPRKR